ncbi:MAG TPA: EAL domain-containing protein [Polyangia bacterium]|nr:EAL domain-containing protein [Polyangia bacterium]
MSFMGVGGLSGADSQPSAGPEGEHQGHILLVDDEPSIARGYARLLTLAGYLVETANDGREAAERTRVCSFDAIVSDITMPEMSGLAFLRSVREHDLDVPVILMTGGPAIESAMQALEHGALRYLIKPVEPKHLEEVVARAVRLHKMAKIKREALELFHLEGKHLGDRAGLEVRFANALSTLWVAYQPIISWSGQNVFAYEALVRNEEPTLRSPQDLFEAAERLGRLRELGRMIRDRVASKVVDLPQPGLVFVNVHALELEDDSLYSPAGALSPFASRVILEITERAPLERINDVSGRVAQLRAMGYRIAVDDLGAGYAGLTSFAQLEPEVVKVDMSLIRGLDRSPTKQKLVHSIVGLCRGLGIQMIAEGIETEPERDTLISLGGDLCQGYLFARPGRAFPTAVLRAVPEPG